MPRGAENTIEQSSLPIDPKSGTRIQAAPTLERNATNIISKMERERDRIYDEFVLACDAEGVEGMVLKSHPYVSRVGVSCECWLPTERDNRLRERVSTELTIRGCDYHRFECEIDIVLKRGSESETCRSIISFSPDTARMVVRYLLRRENTYQFNCCRTSFFKLWMPRNKIVIPHDPLQIAGIGMLLLGFAYLVFLAEMPSNSVPVPAVQSGAAIVIFLVGTASLALLKHRRKRKLYVISSGKPLEEPRKLLRMDSWQTLVTGLGKEIDKVKSGVRAELRPAEHDGARLSDERIWYRGVDGKEEREQMVITFRRAIEFIHIYAYGDDLFVGWDAHVNGGTWLENRVGIRRDPKTKAPCQLNSIFAGWQSPSEYDVTDAETLIERVHAAVTQVVKRIMAEHKIDQDIDFKIQQRGQRQGIVGHGDVAEAKPRSRFKRQA
jgi:hypothetical protein